LIMLNNLSEMLQFLSEKDAFLASVEYTSGRYSFSTELIEKDYLCSLILKYLYSNEETPLVFKGGTLLAKVHANFYRLSEDLDFSISISNSSTRKQRSQKIDATKKILNAICEYLPIFKIKKAITGSDESRQYNMELNYKSLLTQKDEKILIEIGLRDELIQRPVNAFAKTLLSDPFLREDKVTPFPLACLTLKEAYSEKIRAALTRKKLAIRDFFDLDYALKNKIINFKDPLFLDLIYKKIKNEKLSDELLRKESVSVLHEKVDGELVPTLRKKEIDNFDLEKVIRQLLKIVSDARVMAK